MAAILILPYSSPHKQSKKLCVNADTGQERNRGSTYDEGKIACRILLVWFCILYSGCSILYSRFVALPLVFAVLVMAGAALSGVAVLLVSGVYAGKGILLGIVLGVLLFRAYRKNRMAEAAVKA